MSKTATRPCADPTREAILTNARKLFVKKGFAGTSISEIAKAAGINQSLIYHHFKNKEDLWISVKNSAKEEYDSLKHHHYQDLFAMDDAADFLTAIISYRFGIYDAKPDIRRMIDWQLLEHSSDKLIGMKKYFIDRVYQHLQAFQNQGQIINHTSPELIFTMICSAATGFWRSHKDLEKSVPCEQLPEVKQQYLQLCIDTLVGGLVNKNQLQ